MNKMNKKDMCVCVCVYIIICYVHYIYYLAMRKKDIIPSKISQTKEV